MTQVAVEQILVTLRKPVIDLDQSLSRAAAAR
jgi:hypothetical protein